MATRSSPLDEAGARRLAEEWFRDGTGPESLAAILLRVAGEERNIEALTRGRSRPAPPRPGKAKRRTAKRRKA